MPTRTILTCVRADRANLSKLLAFQGRELIAESAKKRLAFATTLIEFYADILLTSYRTDDADAVAHELNSLRNRVKTEHLKYESKYPAKFSGIAYEFPNLDRFNALAAAKTAKPAKTTESDGQTALPFDNANTLEKRLDRLESILARLDRHLQPTEEK